MKLILHDLKNEYAETLLTQVHNDVVLFSSIPVVKPCIGCFGCWLKTPGMCVLNDRAQDFIKLLSKTDQLHIVSRLLYGGLSAEVKAVLDRCIGYILPYFEIQNGAMHHPSRYDNDLKIHYYIYSDKEISAEETQTMRGIANANANNFSSSNHTCMFYDNRNKLLEVLHENLSD